jgi:cobalt/nickel transport protein
MRSVRLFSWLAFVALMTLTASPAMAHFGMVIPSDSMVMQEDSRTVNLALSFSHPMEMVGMPLEKPKVFSVKYAYFLWSKIQISNLF